MILPFPPTSIWVANARPQHSITNLSNKKGANLLTRGSIKFQLSFFCGMYLKLATTSSILSKLVASEIHTCICVKGGNRL